MKSRIIPPPYYFEKRQTSKLPLTIAFSVLGAGIAALAILLLTSGKEDHNTNNDGKVKRKSEVSNILSPEDNL